MSKAEIDRVKGDLAVIQQAMGLKLTFGWETVAFGAVLCTAAGVAAAVSLSGGNGWTQIGPFAATFVLIMIWLYVKGRRDQNLSHEFKLQVGLSITVYAVMIYAAFGYWSAAVLEPAIGPVRTAGLDCASVGYVAIFSSILVLNSLKSRQRYYCLGLATGLLLTGLLIPIAGRHQSYFLAHGFMSVGVITGAIIQWAQLRKAARHVAD